MTDGGSIAPEPKSGDDEGEFDAWVRTLNERRAEIETAAVLEQVDEEVGKKCYLCDEVPIAIIILEQQRPDEPAKILLPREKLEPGKGRAQFASSRAHGLCMKHLYQVIRWLEGGGE